MYGSPEKQTKYRAGRSSIAPFRFREEFMSKPALRRDKYSLRELHQEIDLYDRKLAHLAKFAEFASCTDREEARSKMLAKRAPLEKTALKLVAAGVEYEEKDLPRSFRTMNLVHSRAGKNLTLIRPA
jgi:hypothetical protein